MNNVINSTAGLPGKVAENGMKCLNTHLLFMGLTLGITYYKSENISHLGDTI
jgi:hypothetical protein